MFKTSARLMLFSVSVLACLSLQAQEEADTENDVVDTQWLVLHAGSLLAVPGEAPQTDVTLVVRNARVDRIETGFLSPDAIGGDAQIEVIDLRNHFVLPGLMDSHVHLRDQPSRGGGRRERAHRELGLERSRLHPDRDPSRRSQDRHDCERSGAPYCA